MNLHDKRILIIKPSSLGDVVHTVPLVHAIKRVYPNSHIGWIVHRSFAGVLENDPDVDELIPISIPSTSDPHATWRTYIHSAMALLEAMRSCRKSFKQRPYHVSLDLQASFRSGLMGMTNPDALRVGFADARELNTLFQRDLVTCTEQEVHAVDKNMAFARYLGVKPLAQDYRLTVGTHAKERVMAFLATNGVIESDAIVYMNPCARWTTKLWNVHSWARVIQLLNEWGGLKIVLGGAPGDLPYLRKVRDLSGAAPVISAGRLTLAESAALIEHSSIYLGVDSGPMHIASFVGTPAVALFGPTDPARVGPYGDDHAVVCRDGLSCLGCRKRSCELPRCMDGIDPEEVARVCFRILERHNYQPRVIRSPMIKDPPS